MKTRFDATWNNFKSTRIKYLRNFAHTPFDLTAPMVDIQMAGKQIGCANPTMHQTVSHIAPFCNRNVHMCAHFYYKMVHVRYLSDALWDSWGGCIAPFVKMVLVLVGSDAAETTVIQKISFISCHTIVKENISINVFHVKIIKIGTVRFVMWDYVGFL